MLKRRDFLKIMVLSSLSLRAEAKELIRNGNTPFKEALYYGKLGDARVCCRLCPRQCTIANGESGFCRGRKNIAGTLYSLGYAAPCAIHIDPIEKKPFYNYLPRSRSFSIASAGCNLRCKFCQNWDISQVSPLDTMNHAAPPAEVARTAQLKGCRTVAYTYTEPSTYFEYMLDTAKAVRKLGLFNVYHSNGYIRQEPLKELCKYLDAANIDLKGFSGEFYRDVCEATLEPVLETLKTLKKSGVWVEITNLVIPGHNDKESMVRDMARWIRKNLGAETPLHFSRFFPLYKMTAIVPTPVETLERVRDMAMKEGLRYVYIGNLPGHGGNSTYCPRCGNMIVKRSGFSVIDIQVKDGKCGYCGGRIHGRWG